MRFCSLRRRGKSFTEMWMGNSCYPLGPKLIGASPAVQPGFTHWSFMSAQPPLRAIGLDKPLLPVLYNRMDQLLLIENALALQRTEHQISVTLSQLSMGSRNAEDFVEKHLLDKEVRPSIHTIWFHDEGLRHHSHVLNNLAAHHLVPLFSLISYDVERGKMTVFQAEELYEELMDHSVAQPKIVQRELANQMVRVYCLNDSLDEAKDVIEEMRAKGIRRTFVTYAPLFRYIREREDAEEQVKLLQFVYKMEGGRLAKFAFIDVPRSLYMFGVFFRYNWQAITFSVATISSAIFFFYANIGFTE